MKDKLYKNSALNKRTTVDLTVKTALFSSVLFTTTFFTAVTNAEESAAKAGGNVKSEEIEQIVVTANRSQQDYFLSLSATEVISQADIQILQPQNITELIGSIAGVSVANSGGPGQSSSVFMRGTNGNHTLVLVDGVRVGSATLGTTSFSTMSVSLIDRIEVVKGPRGALWGADAIGGVIQIFTKKLTSGEGSITAGFGSHGYYKTEAAVGFGNELHSLTLSAGVEESDGFNSTDFPGQEDDDGYDRQSFSLNGYSQITQAYSVDLISRYEQGGSGYDNPYGGADENEYENYSIKVGTAYRGSNLLVEASLATSQDQAGTFTSNAQPKVVNEITTKRDQFGLLGQYTFSEKTSLVGGFDWYTEKASNTGATYDQDKRTANAVFVQARHQLSNFLFEGAVRQDDIQGLDKETTYNLSAGYQLSNDWLFALSRGTGFKAPTFNDLYWPGSGNPLLKPESVESSELLIRTQFGIGSVELSFYDSDIKNLIAWAPNAQGQWQPANVDSAIAKGVDLTVSLQTGELSHLLAAGYVDTEDASTGNALLRRPELTATYTLGYQVDDLNANLVLDYRGESIDNQYTQEALDAVLLTHISLSYDISGHLSVFAKVNNLFDKDYQVAEDYLTDGINYQVSATYTF